MQPTSQIQKQINTALDQNQNSTNEKENIELKTRLEPIHLLSAVNIDKDNPAYSFTCINKSSAAATMATVHEKYQKTFGLNLKAENDKNREALFQRLAYPMQNGDRLIRPLQDDMPTFIAQKLKALAATENPANRALQKLLGTNLTLLTSEELDILNKVLELQWLVKHNIVKTDNKSNSESNTIIKDIVPLFFEFRDINHDFRDTQQLLLAYTKINNSGDDPLLGSWTDEHHLTQKYREQTKGNTFSCFYGVEYWVDYDYQKGTYYKIHNLRLPDGKIIKQYETPQEQIFTHPHLQVILILKMFELIRLAGPVIWGTVIRSEPKKIKSLIGILFRDLIIHKPGPLDLTDHMIRILPPHNREDCEVKELADNQSKALRSIYLSLLRGKTEEAFKKLNEGALSFYECFNPKEEFCLLSVAFLSDQPLAFIERLLEHWLTSKEYHLQPYKHAEILHNALFRILIYFCPDFGLDFNRYINSIKNDWRLDYKEQEELRAQNLPKFKPKKEQLSNFLQFICHYSSRYDHTNPDLQILLYPINAMNPNLYSNSSLKKELKITLFDLILFSGSPEMLIKIQPFIQRPFSNGGSKLSLFFAIFLRSIKLMEQSLALGSDPNEPFYFDENILSTLGWEDLVKKKIHNAASGMTPLMWAAALGFDDMLEGLFKFSQSINRQSMSKPIELDKALVSTTGTFGNATENHAIWAIEQEGFTALMFAIQNQHENCVRILLSKKPNIIHYAGNGLHALTLAQTTKHAGIIKCLKDYAESLSIFALLPLTVSFESSPLFKIIQESTQYKYKMVSHITSIIIRKPDQTLAILPNPTGAIHPFISMMSSLFNREKLMRYLNNHYDTHDFNENTCSLHRLGIVSFGCQQIECHYANEFLLLDIRCKKLFEHINKVEHLHDSHTDNDTSFYIMIRNMIGKMDGICDFNSDELNALNFCYKNILTNQATALRYTGYISKNDHFKGINLLSKRDKTCLIPDPEKDELSNSRPKYSNAFIKIRELKYIELEYLDKIVQLNLIFLAEDFTVAEFEKLLPLKLPNEASLKYEFSSSIDILFKHDRVDLLKSFEIYIRRIYPAFRDIDNIAKRFFESHSINYYSPFNMLNHFADSVNKETLESACADYLTHHSTNYSYRSEEFDPFKTQQMVRSIIILRGLNANSLHQHLFNIRNLPFFKIIWSFYKAKKQEATSLSIGNEFDKDENDHPLLIQLLENEITNRSEEIMQFLLTQSRFKIDEIDKLTLTVVQDFRFDSLKVLLPLASLAARRTAWNLFFNRYEKIWWVKFKNKPDESNLINGWNKEVLNMVRLFLYSSNINHELGADSNKSTIIFEPDLKELALALRAAFAQQEIPLFMELQRLIKPNADKQLSFNFAEVIKDLKEINEENEAFFNHLLNGLIDPRSDSTLLIPMVQCLSLNEDNNLANNANPRARFLQKYFKEHYPKVAPLLVTIEDAIRKDNDKSLAEALNTGIDPDISLFIQDDSPKVSVASPIASPNPVPNASVPNASVIVKYKRVTLIEFAMQSNSYNCIGLLLERGVVVRNMGYGRNALTERMRDNLIDGGRHKILNLMLKNNNELECIWNDLNKHYKRSLQSHSIHTNSTMQYFKTVFRNLWNRSERTPAGSKPQALDGPHHLTDQFFKSLIEHCAALSKSISTKDPVALEKLIQGIPQSLLLRCLMDLDVLSQYTASRENIKIFSKNQLKPKKQIDLKMFRVIQTLLVHIRVVPHSHSFLLMGVFSLVRILEGNLNKRLEISSPVSLLKTISQIPCVLQHPVALWLDCICNLDIRQLKTLLKFDAAKELHKQALTINLDNPIYQDQWKCYKIKIGSQKKLLTAFQLELNPLTLFLIACSNINYVKADPSNRKLLTFFKIILESNCLELIQSNTAIITQLINECSKELANGLQAVLQQVINHAERQEKNWGLIGLCSRFMSANRGPYQHSIKPLTAAILSFAGYKDAKPKDGDKKTAAEQISIDPNNKEPEKTPAPESRIIPFDKLILSQYYRNLMCELLSQSSRKPKNFVKIRD